MEVPTGQYLNFIFKKYAVRQATLTKMGAATNINEEEYKVSLSMQVGSDGAITNRIDVRAVNAAPTKLIEEQAQKGSLVDETTFW